MQDLETIVARAAAEFAAAGDPASLENAKAKYLGKTGELTVFRSSFASIPNEEKKAAGMAFNSAKERIEAALEARRGQLALAKLESRLAEEALGAIARKAIERKTGARGLRSIMESILLDTMFDLPSLEGVEEVVISKEVVEGTARPLYIYADRAGDAGASA